jgi:hypothetical protein
MSLHLFGIRHHGPGCAKSLAKALDTLKPDALVLEASEELEGLWQWLNQPDLIPPVAALVWVQNEANLASFYPFADFSPEWIALKHAQQAGIPIINMDLPLRLSLAQKRVAALAAEAAAKAAQEEQTSETTDVTDAAILLEDNGTTFEDPIDALAQAAGYDDGELWWEHLVESQDNQLVFPAILEAMTAVREAGLGRDQDPENLLREAWMRQSIRSAQKQGYQRIAVVCGAFHAPAITQSKIDQKGGAKDDSALIKAQTATLPKLKTQATWVPWAFSRLGMASGYGAGVTAPGWYQYLWETQDNVAIGWLSRMAVQLRQHDLDAPSASVIEAVRLSNTLAALRKRREPDLSDLREAALATFCLGQALVLARAERDLLMDGRGVDYFGRVPEALPQSPLQEDFAQENKRLRLKLEAGEKVLELDLRTDNDRARSVHFWRLRLLELNWADTAHTRSKGTFKESWRLRWLPDNVLKLIESGRKGETVEKAAQTCLNESLVSKQQLPDLLELADTALKASLPLGNIVAGIAARAAVATDIEELLSGLPRLCELARYGDVRQTDLSQFEVLLDGLLTRTCESLPNAYAQLNPDAAAHLGKILDTAHSALQLLDDEHKTTAWLHALGQLAAASTTPPLLHGRCWRLLWDAEKVELQAVQTTLQRALSAANPPLEASQWLEGFIKGSVHLLLGQPALLASISAWLAGLSAFEELLPLIRRSFSVFETAERRLLLEEIRQSSQPAALVLDSGFNPEKVAEVQAGLAFWWGVAA